ncbi:D-alanine--D-alanine ligase family protein [Timonella sp. A28]|uniref:D-alanine--D-alanine ligase family protein n=1 Tax=Timonella sp. A28 TaxID=3442640 RepID=UPI003EBB9E79
MSNLSASQTQPTSAAASSSAKTRVLVLFGGRSGEHPISCITAGSVLQAIDRTRFEVIPVGITRQGKWVLLNDELSDVQTGNNSLPFVADNGTEVILPFSSDDSTIRVIRGTEISSLGRVDVVFPLIHGPFGEDGTLQGLLELADMRYVGPGVFASAVGMDKHYMKVVLQGHDIPVTPFVTVLPGQWATRRAEVVKKIEALNFPVFVKPARAGSSLGISKVATVDGLDAAMEYAHKHDPKVIVETGLEGREIECAVLGGKDGAPARASYPGEVAVASKDYDFYDFEAKYLDDAAVELSCPAELSDDVTQRVRQLAIDTFEALGCEGLSRVDVFVQPDNSIIINEINTMPGFTPISMYPRMWERTGLNYSDLVTELIDLALQRPVGLR